MPTASRAERKLRRIKIDRRKAYNMLDIALGQRDNERMKSFGLMEELKKYVDPKTGKPYVLEGVNDSKPYGSVASQLDLTPPNEDNLNG